jgi:hypothetical protein
VIRRSRDRTRATAADGWRLPARLLLAAGAAILAALLPVAGAAWAADPPNSLTIVGAGLSSPISIRSDAQQDLYTAVIRQVSWMAGRTGDFAKANPGTLGPKYTITVFTGGVARQVYEVYPEAAGGPRAHRPANQPKSRSTDAWFYATVTLPNVLRAAGVPLPEPTASGQAGGVGYADPQYQPDDLSTTSSFSFGKELGEARLAFAATAATAVLVLLLLFLAAQFSRRRWTRRWSR